MLYFDMTLDSDLILSKTDMKDLCVVWFFNSQFLSLKMKPWSNTQKLRQSSDSCDSVMEMVLEMSKSKKGSYCHTEVIETDVLTIDIHFLYTFIYR